MYASRDRRRAEPRILYWFRTPPHVRVGRAALDEEAIRSIEEHNPDLTFDWTRILKAKPPPPPVEESEYDRRRRERGAKSRRADRPPAQVAEPRRREPPAEALPQPPAIEKAEDAPEELAAAAVEAWSGPDEEAAPEAESAALPPGLHVEERLGPEGFSRLRGRYAELMARISVRVQDPARLADLRTDAERLNPDTWITDEEARAGIEGFDAAYEALRARLGRRRRRSRRGGARRRRSREGPAVGAVAGGEPPVAADEPAGPADAIGDEVDTSEPAGGDDEPE